MKFVSTSNPRLELSLAEALSCSNAPDGGLLMPARIPRLPDAFYNNIGELSLQETAYVVATSFFGDDIDPRTLKFITDRAFAAGIPLSSPEGPSAPSILELFHGPTLSVNDFGAELMAGLLDASRKKKESRLTVLAASKGNSAVAIASAFSRLKECDIFCVCPHGSLRRRRHSILSSFGSGIHLVETSGSVDECRETVDRYVAEERRNGKKDLINAGSNNIARLIAEVCFFLHAYGRIQAEIGAEKAAGSVFVMPSGKGTAAVAAIIARRMGCPIGKIVAAQMPDDPDPRTLPRLLSLCGNPAGIDREIESRKVTEDTIASTMRELRSRGVASLATKTAGAYSVAQEFAGKGVPVVSLAPIHAAVDIDSFTRITGAPVELPVQLTRLMSRHLVPIERIMPTVAALRRFMQGGTSNSESHFTNNTLHSQTK